MEKLASGIFSLLLGIGGLCTGIAKLRARKALNRWNTTRGRVIERGTYQPNTPMLSAPAFRYAPLVKYAYEIDGKEFVNDCIYPKRIQLPPHNTRAWAQKRADSFADEVTVYYNSADPTESYLQQTSRMLLYIVVAVSVLLLLIGLTILLN